MTRAQLEILVHTTALKYGLDPALMCAIVEQESSWDTFSIRCESESGFMRRYGQAYVQLVKQSVSKNDDKWIVFEDLFYTSYGLMQTMYPVIIETFPDAAKALKFPTYLCKPEIGVEYGCRLFLKNSEQQAAISKKPYSFGTVVATLLILVRL